MRERDGHPPSGTGASTKDPLSVRVACAVYRLILRLCLDAEAARFRPQMLQTFRALCLRRRRDRSALSLAGFVVGEAVDVAGAGRRAARRLGAGPAGRPGQRGRPNRPVKGSARGAVAVAIDTIVVDLRVANRVLRRRPAFALSALATLTLGIGATTAIFTVVDNLLIRPLPFPESDRLVELWSWELGGNNGMPVVEPALRQAWSEQTDLFDALEVFAEGSRILVDDEQPEQIRVTAMTHGLFELLGARPAIGRPMIAADGASDARPVVLLSDGLWRRRFGADPEVVGGTVRIEATTYDVIGVMPRSFAFPDGNTQVWMPLADDAPGYPIGRLASGLTIEAAQQRADELAPRFAEDALAEPGWGIQLFSLRDTLFGIGSNATRTLWIMFGAVALLLAIAAANVANLLLSHTAARQHELAVRTALGAGRGRIARQILFEAGSLGLGGAVLGALLALAGVRLATALAPQRLTYLSSRPIVVDGRVLAFATLVALGITLAVAALPAVRTSSSRRIRALGESRGHTGGRRQQRLRSVLVIAELALAVVLLVAAGLLVRTMAALLHVDPGFDTGVTVVTVNPSPERYREAAAQRLLVAQLAELAGSLPGVEGVAITTGAPPFLSSYSSANRAEAEGQPPPTGVFRGGRVTDASQVEFLHVVNGSDDYFRVLRIPLLEGRSFAPGDHDAEVAVISEDFARKFWHGDSPVGRRLRLREGAPWLTVIGVVADVRQTGLDSPAGGLDIYYPMAQARPGASRLYILLRGRIDLATLLPALRRRLRSLDPQLPISSASSMAELLSVDLAGPRFNMFLLVGFAAAALALAAVGIHGVLTYNVLQRRREIGVRMALGADRTRVLRGVVGDGMSLTAIGLGAGGVATWALTRFMRSVLFEVEPLDRPTLFAVAAVLTAIALIACAVPALRASRVDPMTALRAD